MKHTPKNKLTFIAILLMVMVLMLATIIGCSGGGGGGSDSDSSDVVDENATITGTVYDQSGLPLSGATVSWESSSDSLNKRSGSTTTDTNGEFTLNNVSQGNIILTAVKGSYACQQEVYVASNITTTAILNVDPVGQISGTVKSSDTQAVIYGAAVQLTESDNTSLSCLTDSSGSYTFSYVPEGTHTLTVTKSLYQSSTVTVDVTAGETTYKYFSLHPTSTPTSSPTTTPTSNPTTTPTSSPTVSPAPAFTGKVYAVIIGIDDYPGFNNDLYYCESDAQAARSAFQSSTMWSDATIYFITNKQATESNILNTITSIKSTASSDDLFVMTYSGHGTNTDGRAALCVWNDSVTDWAYINDSELASAISGMPCTSALFIDACFSGGLIGKNLTGENNGSKRTARVYAGAPGYSNSFTGTFNPKSARSVEDISNLVCVTASSGTEYSWESYDLEHGVFSYYYTEALGSTSSAGPADTNSNGSVSAEEVYAYVYPKVTALVSSWSSQYTQTPQMEDNYSSSSNGELSVKQ